MLRFQHPWTLWWLLAAIVPLWLHWRRRRPVRELDWAAMELLRRALRRQRLRWRVQDLVLLLLRMATIFVLVLALAQPEWSAISRPGGGSAKVATHHLLLLDSSFSMQTTAGGTSRFERARQRALSLIDRQPPRDQFSVWLADPMPRPVLFPPSSNHRDVQRTLATLQPSAGRSDWSRLPEVFTSYQTESTAEPTQGWLLSDMQRSAGFDAMNALPAAWQQFMRQTQLRIIDVGDTVVDNTAVTSLNVRRGRAIIHEPCVIVSDIRNYSPRQELTTVVTFYVSGSAVAQQSVRIPPRDKISVEFSHVFHQTGTVELKVQTAGDQLAIDDQRYGTIDVVDRVPVVCVGGTMEDVAYTASALEAEGTDGTRFRVERVDADRVRGPFTNVEVVVVCNVAHIAATDVARWMEHVRGGGGLLVFLGGHVDNESYRQAVTAAQAAAKEPDRRFFPADMGPVQPDGTYEFDTHSIVHPWLQRFAESETGSLRSTPIWRYVQLDPVPGAERLLDYAHGAAALVGHRYGDGYVLLCGTPASINQLAAEDWNALPVWPSFPPLVRELAWYAAQPRTANAQVAERIGGPLRRRVTEVEIQPPLDSPTPYPSRQATAVSSDQHARWEYADTDTPGIYRIVPLDGEEPSQRVAVNVDCRESDLLRIDDRDLAGQHLSPGSPTWIAIDGNPRSPQRWQRAALLLVLAFMLAEPWWQSRSLIAKATR